MDTRQHILATAERILQERGLARITTRDITRAAGLAAGTLYVHFPHKEDLFLAIIQRHLPAFVPTVQPEQAGTQPLNASLEAIAQAAVGYYAELIPLAASLFADPSLLLRHQAWMAEHGGPERIYERVAAYIVAEQRVGRIYQSCEPRAVAVALLGPCFQYAFMRHFLGTDPFEQSVNEFVASMIAPLLSGLTTAVY
ncbi:MAG TPA: TetR/AcrR family transcriptional regulator [Ktedonobacteraceae bacterium]